MGDLIASSGTRKGIEKLASEYYHSDIKVEGSSVYNSKGKIGSVKVVKKGGRYRLERA